MKDQVLQFLGAPGKTGSERFNKALELYRKSKGHDAGRVRFYNNLGFSQDRLEGLVYELKKLHSITDLQVANARRAAMKPVEKEEESPLTPAVGLTEYLAEVVAFDVSKATEEELAEAAVRLRNVIGIEANLRNSTDAEFLTQFQDVIGSYPTEEREEALNNLQAAIKDLNPKTDPAIALIPVKDIDVVITEENEDEPEKEEKIPAQEETPTEDLPVDPFKQKLADFDLEQEKYNSIKSFAAEVSDVIGEDPADQKAATLKAFIEEAKKKLAQS
jgi:hypothetical protein